MKFRTEIKTRWVDMTIGGVTQQIEEKYEQKTPIMPRDWDVLSTQIGFGLVGVLTMISIAWSTISIGTLLGGGVGFLAAILFDLSWAVCLILEWKSRYDPDKRAFPRRLGWALLFVTMAFIFWHGAILDNIALAVVGASVSLFAKVLWLGVMKHVDKDLSPEHRQWVNRMISEANAKLAVAEIQRKVARMEDDALAQKLALEMSRSGFDIDVISTDSVAALPAHTVATPPALPTHSMATPPAHTVAAVRAQYEPGTVEYDHSKFADPSRPHDPVVYFARQGDNVRIGWSTGLAKRVADLDDVLRVEYGDDVYERVVRAQFEEYRIGGTESFLLEGELAEYIGLEYDRSTGRYEATPPHTVPTPRLRSVPTPPHTVGGSVTPSTAGSVATPPHTAGDSVTPSVSDSTATPPHTVDDSTVRTTEGYDRNTAVAEMVDMIRAGNGPSYNEAEKLFGRPKSTVVGWVKAARKEAEG